MSPASDANWLTISPLQGDTPTEVNISANPTGLPEGTHGGQITFTAPNAPNSPQTITVSLNIRAPVGPTPTPGPSPTATSTPLAEGEKIYLSLLLSR